MQQGKKVKILDLYMIIVLLFPLFTVAMNEGPLNKLLLAAMVFLHVVYLAKCGMTKKSFSYLMVTALVYVYSLLETEFPLTNLNVLFYFPVLVLYMCLFRDWGEKIEEWILGHEKTIRNMVALWSVVVGFSAFLPGCYYIKEGGARYFGSFCGTIFRLGPAAIFIQIMVLVLMAYFRKKQYFFYMAVPMYCFFMGSSRTYLVLGVCLFTIGWYWFGVSRKQFLATIIPLFAITLFLLMRSSLGAKILYTLDSSNYGDFWYRITSSRSMFWAKDLTAWMEEPLLNKLFGSGIEYTVQKSGLWGHNDFIEILCAYGVTGVLLYCALFYDCIRRNVKGCGAPWFVNACLILVWLFNAFFNMHFTYFCCVLSYPFAVMAVRRYGSGRREQSLAEEKKPEPVPSAENRGMENG